MRIDGQLWSVGQVKKNFRKNRANFNETNLVQHLVVQYNNSTFLSSSAMCQ